MKTKCYCTYCSKHPLFNVRKEIGYPLTGWAMGDIIWKSEFENHGREVDCLVPDFFGDEGFYLGDATNFEYPITAYGDGSSITGFREGGMTVDAYCMAEDYEGK